MASVRLAVTIRSEAWRSSNASVREIIKAADTIMDRHPKARASLLGVTGSPKLGRATMTFRLEEDLRG